MNKTEKQFVKAWQRCHDRVWLWAVYLLISGLEIINRLRGWFMSRPQARALLIAVVVLVATAVWVFADKLAPRANLLLGALIALSIIATIIILFLPFGGDNNE